MCFSWFFFSNIFLVFLKEGEKKEKVRWIEGWDGFERNWGKHIQSYEKNVSKLKKEEENKCTLRWKATGN